MRPVNLTLLTALTLLVPTVGLAPAPADPPPPPEWANWPTSWSPDDPGELSAESLLLAPAGRDGRVIVRDGHFYSGDRRVRFWGVNLAFSANFPPHDVANALARRFARYGINAVRFHHMDNQPFPNGIFADAKLEALSPEALDRLDYFVAVLKARGVYADLNLHVSRSYTHFHGTGGKDGPKIDKMVDIFDPELIASQRRYAHDLLTHVNAYTHARYADEPAVGIVEVNNENSLFMWGAEQHLAELPEPYAAELRRRWNGWLTTKYGDRSGLAAAWDAGASPAGPNLLHDPVGLTVGRAGSPWHVEQHDGAAASATPIAGGVRLDVTRVDGTEWHAQFNQGGLAFKRGQAYRGTFTVRADKPVTIAVGVGQAHEPWQAVGGYRTVHVTTEPRTVAVGFVASADEPNARFNFSVGGGVAAINLTDIDLHAGGAIGLAASEDPSTGTVATHAGDPETPPRHDDWLRFLADTESAYYTGMLTYLHADLGVKCPVTGTIGFGPLGTQVQSKMDFVDAHAYWEHPSFPHKAWDANDWTIENKPMVADPAHATLWSLAATRVAGKPFTVTEYQHPAPNDYAAECVPEIASFAAAQDWDGVFLFAYSHDAKYDKGRIASFFDIEGNPTKMTQMPIEARLFLGPLAAGPGPLAGNPDSERFTLPITSEQVLAGANSTDMAGFLRSALGPYYSVDFGRQISVRFTAVSEAAAGATGRVRGSNWTADGIRWASPTATVEVSVGGKPERSQFAAIVVVSDEPGKAMADARRLLVTAVARARNTDLGWNAARTSVGNRWGRAPVQIEVVKTDLRVPGRWSHAYALDPTGRRTAVDVAEPDGTDTVLHLGRSAALAYVVVR